MKEIDTWRKYMNKRRVTLAISLLILILLYIFKNTSLLMRSLSAISLLFVFYLIDHYFDLEFKEIHYLFIITIAISSFLLSPLYYTYPQYDKIQHIFQPIMFASIIFHLVNRLKLKPILKLTFLFFIVIGSLGMFEIGEYALDYFFDLKLQGVFLRNIQGLEKYDILLDRIDDTMIDLSLGVLGTLIYLVVIFFSGKRKSFYSAF